MFYLICVIASFLFFPQARIPQGSVAPNSVSGIDVFIRSSGPAPQVIVGATNATPIVLTTQKKLFTNVCTIGSKCDCAVIAVTMGVGNSSANGNRKCVYVDDTHVSLYDQSGSAVAGNGNWFNGQSTYQGNPQTIQWLAATTKMTIPSNPGPLGFLDGTNGDLTRKVSLSTSNGLNSSTGIVVSGCSGGINCVVTVNTIYNPSTFGRIPVGVGQHFSITGTGTNLDICGDTTWSGRPGAQAPYTIASVTSSSWTSTPFSCSLSNGNLTHNNDHCGPSATPDDTIGGNLPCPRVSQMFWRTSSPWENLLSAMVANHLTSFTDWPTFFDGGLGQPGSALPAFRSMAAVRFLVDPQVTPGYTSGHSLWLDEIIDSLNKDYRIGGVGYLYNTGALALEPSSDYNSTISLLGQSLNYAVATHSPEGSYWTSGEKQAFLNRTYNDLNDPTVSACLTTNQDAANQSTHNIVLSGSLRSLDSGGLNDATHAQLPTTDPHYNGGNANPLLGYYVGTVIKLDNGSVGIDYVKATYGLITSHSTTGQLVVNAWLQNSGNGGGVTPTLTNAASVTYTGGLTVTGTTGQYVAVTWNGNGVGLVQLTGSTTLGSTVKILTSGVGPFSSYGVDTFRTTATTVSGTPSLTIVSGTNYTIFDTIKLTTTGTAAHTTVTFTKTSSLSSFIQPGDGIIGFYGWTNNFSTSQSMSYVTSVGSGTLNVINGSSPTASSTIPSMAWRVPQWQNGDCGLLVATKANSNASHGAVQALYGPGAGIQLQGTYPNLFLPDSVLNGGGSAPTGRLLLDLATMVDDPRAITDLSEESSYIFDGGIAPIMDFSTGRLRDGPNYSRDSDMPAVAQFLWAMASSFPSYPNLALNGAWITNLPIFNMFSILPQNGVQAWTAGFADGGATGMGGGALGDHSTDFSYANVFDPNFFFNPTSTNSGWYRHAMETISPSGNLWGAVEYDSMAMGALFLDPRVPSIPYSGTNQYAFNQSSSSQVAVLTGWSPTFRGDMMISRTCWFVNSGDCTYVQLDGATFSSEVYDAPRVGNLAIWNNGCLLGGDQNPCNSFYGNDPSTVGDVLDFGAGGTNQFKTGSIGDIGYTPFTSVIGSTQFGDSLSRFAGACLSVAPNYRGVSLDHAFQCFVHQKYPSGHDQWVWDFKDASLTSGTTSIDWHLQYPQNGSFQNGFGGYTTGSTTYLGGNTIKELEDGVNGRVFGLMSYITSPNPFTLHDDGSAYSGGNGYTHRFTVAGGVSVGSAVGKFSSVVCHKVMTSLSDTTLSAVDLNPDSNWTGAVCSGSNSNAVGLFGLNGTHGSIPSFTTSFSGVGDWFFQGLTPGTYNVTVNGIAVGGSPFTVGVGDNSIEFQNTSGLVIVF